MDRKLLYRINSLLKQIGFIESDLDDILSEGLKPNTRLTRATAFSIAQIGEQMTKLETLLKDEYPTIPWQSARGMRNFIVHDYDSVDVEQLTLTVKQDLPELKRAFLQIKEDIKTKKEA